MKRLLVPEGRRVYESAELLPGRARLGSKGASEESLNDSGSSSSVRTDQDVLDAEDEDAVEAALTN